MARQIIVTSVTRQPDGDHAFTAVFWLAVPANLQAQYTRPTFASAVPLASAVSWGATPAEVAALQNGTVAEVVRDAGQVPAGVASATVEAALQAAYTAAQAALNAQSPTKSFVGASFDGGVWSSFPA